MLRDERSFCMTGFEVKDLNSVVFHGHFPLGPSFATCDLVHVVQQLAGHVHGPSLI